MAAPIWFPEKGNGPPAASIPPGLPENGDGPTVASVGEPVSFDIPPGLQENGDGLPVASSGPVLQQPPVAPVSTKQDVPLVAPSDVDVVQNPLASTLSEDPGGESRQEPQVTQEIQSPVTPDSVSQQPSPVPWPTRATKDASEWLRIVKAGSAAAAEAAAAGAGTCPPSPVRPPPGLNQPPSHGQMTEGTKMMMSSKWVDVGYGLPPPHGVFTGPQCWQLSRPAKRGSWALVEPGPPLTKSSTPPVLVFTPQMHRVLVAQACGWDAAGGALLQGYAPCRCGQCEVSWFASGWTCPAK